ncbi:MAG: AMP-binding protein, partial [Gammaproteobacteria bacterium]
MSANANLYARFAATFTPSRTLLELPDGSRVSYAEAERESARAANALHALGLAPGDRVSVIAEKSPRYLWLYLGCLRAGLVFHPLNTGYTERELAFFIGDAGARLVVSDPALAERVGKACAAAGCAPRQLAMDAAGEGSFAAACTTAADAFATVVRTDGDDAALLYSSGTTGTPKGIRITHGNLYANACALREAWHFTADDILVHALPVFHVHGLFITLGPALLAGATLRFLPRFDPQAVVAALPGATLMAGVPTYYTRLLAAPGFGRAQCATMRLFISGSAPLSEATFHEFHARTGHVILERYGMTE